jgi:arginyl-tRNA synthetase
MPAGRSPSSPSPRFLRYREALGEAVEIPPGLYPGDYLVPVGRRSRPSSAPALLDKPEAEVLPLVARRRAGRHDGADQGGPGPAQHPPRRVLFRAHAARAGGRYRHPLDWLRGEGMVYQGRLEPPKGKTPEDWEDREQTLFRATDFGDDTDRALIKSDGSYTYFAADIAYHRNKYLRGFKHMVNVLGADHSGYVKRLQAAVKAVSHGEADIDVRICQLVRLLKNGEPFKMSSAPATSSPSPMSSRKSAR